MSRGGRGRISARFLVEYKKLKKISNIFANFLSPEYAPGQYNWQGKAIPENGFFLFRSFEFYFD